VLADENVSMAVVVACPTAVLSYENLAEVIVEQQASSDQPIAATLMGGKSVGSAAPMLNDAGVPTYFDPARAVDSLDALRRYGEIQAREYVDPETFDVDRDRARVSWRTRPSAAGTASAWRRWICSTPTVSRRRRGRRQLPGAAETVAEEINDDVVMKIVSPDILHKSDIGGVEVGVAPEDVRDTYEDLVVRARNYQRDATIPRRPGPGNGGPRIGHRDYPRRQPRPAVRPARALRPRRHLRRGAGGHDGPGRAGLRTGGHRDARRNRFGAAVARAARAAGTPSTSQPSWRPSSGSPSSDRLPRDTRTGYQPLVATPDGATAVDLRLTIDQEEL